MFKLIYNIFIAAIIVIAVLLIISLLPITGNYKVLVVKSGSMEPAVKTGSIIIVKPAREYRAGDIITFGKISKTRVPTTHRIHEIRNNNGQLSYITKGDANNAPDAKEVARREVAGRVLLTVPFIGYAIDAAKKPLGFFIIIIIPALLIIAGEVKKIWLEAKKIKKTKNE